MTRTDLINCFVRRRGYGSYLELGVNDIDHNFSHVTCARKYGVDPAADAAGVEFRMTSDEFFRQNTDTFDVVFIDGMHEEHQVDLDIRHALSRLNPGGVVILHDSLPPDEWHQRPASDYRPGENWNGTVWKSVLKYFESSEWDCYVVNCDWGCGVIDTSRQAARSGAPCAEPLDYKRDFSRLKPYTISPEHFLAMLYKVEIFYHIAAIGNWREVVSEHFALLGKVGLHSAHMSFLGEMEGLDHVMRCSADANVNVTIAWLDHRLTLYETPALKTIEDWVRINEGSILYFHTKGVSAPNDPYKRRWRDLMNQHVICNWLENVRHLDEFDLVGVNWRHCPPISHFCGNFWWARSDWIRSLAPFDLYYENPRYPSNWDSGRRLGCEFWISSSAKEPRVKSLFCWNQDFCNPAYWDQFG
jgi:SAM-dependent methyltransferase